MYTYRIVLDAFNSRSGARGARVVTYSQGHNREAALNRIKAVYIARNGAVSDGINPWPGSNNLPDGPYEVRSLPEWEVVSMRSVKKAGEPYVVAEVASV